jgi:hypothetical protein
MKGNVLLVAASVFVIVIFIGGYFAYNALFAPTAISENDGQVGENISNENI